MAENKTSFLLYCDIIHTVNKLSDEQSGILFKHILAYVNDQNPVTNDVIIELVFEPIKQGLKRDLQKYLNICERNKKNGEKGGRPEKKPKKPSRLINNPNNPDEPKKADSDIDSDIEINKYIYSKFYDTEISLSKNNEKYIALVKYIFGENDLSRKLSGLLSITEQLTFEQFSKLITKAELHGVLLMDIVEKIENDKKYWKGKVSLYRTMNNWVESTFLKK